MGARYELARSFRHARCERRLWAQLSQCDTVEQPIAIHMAGIWFESFRNHFYNASSRFRRIEGIPLETEVLYHCVVANYFFVDLVGLKF